MRALIRHSGMVWLSMLVVANVAFITVGFSFQNARMAPVEDGSIPHDLPGLRLVSEMAAAPAPAKAPADALACRSFGPFNAEEEFAELEGRIRAAGGGVDVRHTPVHNEPDYLVFVGQRGKAENARRVLEELKSQSIEGALITRGPYNNTLSVGVFSRADRANIQRERVAQLGYEAGIEEIDRSYDLYHVEARVPAGFEAGGLPSEACAEIARAH